jgi:hypothetical protein
LKVKAIPKAMNTTSYYILSNLISFDLRSVLQNRLVFQKEMSLELSVENCVIKTVYTVKNLMNFNQINDHHK